MNDSLKNSEVYNLGLAENGALKELIKLLEPYQQLSQIVTSNIKNIMESYTLGMQKELGKLVQSTQMVMGECLRSNISALMENLFRDPIYNSLQELSNTLVNYERNEIFSSLNAISDSMKVFASSYISEQLEDIQKIDVSKLVSDNLSSLLHFTELVNAAYSSIQNEPGADKNNIVNIEAEEFAENLQEQISNPVGFQEKVANWTEEKKKKHYICWIIVSFILSVFVIPYLQENFGLPVMTKVASVVKELPAKGAKIIDWLEEGFKAFITEDTNYYYKVSFIDVNGEYKEGYVAKRNLIVIEEITGEETDSSK